MNSAAYLLEIEFRAAELRIVARREGVMHAGRLNKRELARKLATGGFTPASVRRELAELRASISS